MDGFFLELRTGFVCEEKEWVAAFSGPQPVLHTCLYSRIDLGALSHGWNTQRKENTNLLFHLKRYLCATCVYGRIWVKSASCCACVCVCARVSVLDAGILSFFFFLTVTHHGSIVLGFPANHMSGLLMFMPFYINQIENYFWRRNYTAVKHKGKSTKSKHGTKMFFGNLMREVERSLSYAKTMLIFFCKSLFFSEKKNRFTKQY